jgi:3',5'-cyclic-AMP phosphodiesterase
MTMSRRDALRVGGLAALGTLAGLPAVAAGAGRGSKEGRLLRIAHLTDTHIQPELRAHEGLAACLKHVNGLADKPDLIVTGGDHIFDSMATSEARAGEQWDLWTKVLRDENGIPVESCLGNHDVWGWTRSKSKVTGDEPMYGKRWAVEALGMAGRHRAITRAGWRIIFLDSVFPNGESYLAKLDGEQLEWLKGELAASAGMRVLVVSHIPIFSVAVLEFGGKEERTEHKVPEALMHVDAGRLHAMFVKHGNVRACLSGHLHLVDRCEYDGVSYLCNGAVSGNWWKGRHRRCDEGYALVDLYEDGRVEREYVEYGWRA